MWSIGCVTVAILVRRSAFATSPSFEGRRDSAGAIIAAAAEYDLGVLENPEVWGDIDPQPKDFIRRLLILDEKERFTAHQALKHEWFTQEGDQQPLLRRYEKAVAGWKPMWPGWDFKQDVEAFIDRRIPSYDVSSPSGTISAEV